MKTIIVSTTLILCLCRLGAQVYTAPTEKELSQSKGTLVKVLENRMSPDELNNFLEKRTGGSVIGNFQSYASMLYTLHDIAIWNEDKDVNTTRLQTPYPDDYRPTWREFMQMLALQTGCKWHYDFNTGYWVFEKASIRACFDLDLPKGWKARDQKTHIVFVPPVAPVGCDVYMMGHFTPETEKDTQELYEKAKLHASDMFAKRLKEDFTPDDYKRVEIANLDAIYFETTSPREKTDTWRQWAFVIDGWSFLVVSVINEDLEDALLPDVNHMLKTFKITQEEAE